MLNKNGDDCRRGRLMNRTGGSGFKLVVVLGDAPRSPGKVRVCVWSANQHHWSNPQAVAPKTLRPIAYADLSSRHRKVVNDAMEHITTRQGVVSWGKGVYEVGTPWCVERAIKAKPHATVTKLAPATAHVVIEEISVKGKGRIANGRMVSGEITMSAASKSQLQQLNQVLSGWAFGGKKP